MTVLTIHELYERQIKDLPAAERLELLALIATDLADTVVAVPQQRSILELEGLGAELWQGVDAQEYVNSLREEWDQRH